MNIAGIKKANTENGIGIRVSVFVSGCLNHCNGCFNKETWDFNYGYAYTDDVEDRIITELQKPYYEGITILGGDPFELVNQKGVLQLIERVKRTAQIRTYGCIRAICIMLILCLTAADIYHIQQTRY